MKTETKAVAASLVVLLLALSSAGGVTYSWFSVSQEYNVDIGASELDVDYELRSDGSVLDGNTVTLIEGTNNLTLYVTNNNSVPLGFEVSFTIPRYTAYSDSTYTTLVGDLASPDAESVDTTLDSARFNGYLANSLNAITVSYMGGTAQTLGTPNGNNIPYGESNHLSSRTVGDQTWYIIENLYSASYASALAPGSTAVISIVVNVGSGYTANSCLQPTISAIATQPNATDQRTVDLDENLTGSFSVSDLNGYPTDVLFSDSTGMYSVTVGWGAIATSGLETVTVAITDSESKITVNVTGTSSDSSTITLDGDVRYSITVVCNGITGVSNSSSDVQCSLDLGTNGITVTFSDVASEGTHTISYFSAGGQAVTADPGSESVQTEVSA